jgi:hypothetical protein
MKRLTSIYLPYKKGTAPLKRSMSGFDAEMFIVDDKGKLDNSDTLIKLAKKKHITVHKECAKSIIEVVCLPNKNIASSTHNLIKNLARLSEVAEKKDIHLYPFGTYFGKNRPDFRNDTWYNVKRKILTPDRFQNAGKCTGFHFHYALPRGMFNNKTNTLNYRLASKVKRTFLDSYNILNAIDPIITCFMQSSPYVDNTHLAKDSRTVIYRGGRKLNYPNGLYARRQLFGGLSPYKQTLEDLQSTLRRKQTKWKFLMKKAHYSAKHIAPENALDLAWNPVKINKKGTLEYRGSDMNFTRYGLATSVMINFLLKKIQRDFLTVVPMDIDLKDAFKVEGNILFIPPHTLVRNNLQGLSAYEGLHNKDIYLYCKRFYNFIQKIIYKEYKKLLAPIRIMLDNKKSMSDEILTRMRNRGYTKDIPENMARELALFYSSQFKKDIQKTNDLLHNFKHTL